MGVVMGQLEESFFGVCMIKIYGLEFYEIQCVDWFFGDCLCFLFCIIENKVWVDLILEIVGGFVMVGFVVFVGWCLINGEMLLGNLMGIFIGLGIMFLLIWVIGMLNVVVQEGFVVLDCVFVVLDEKFVVVGVLDVLLLNVE